ncbi:hypothetical protein BC940DRAFT_288560 [Gongronella butleri]|nr:hypothetical protein BC940DRAFT_288560 [Gongronella butleri]
MHNHDDQSSPNAPTDEITRQLIPKRKAKDPVLKETVKYYTTFAESTDGSVMAESRVEYWPHVSTPQHNTLPFYYPKVGAYGFSYSSMSESRNGPDVDPLSGTLRLVVSLLEPQAGGEKVLSDQKMRQGLEAIFHRLFRWCIQARLGYKKKAHHDTLVSKDTYDATYKRIKAKYADDLVRNWPEKTDPKKFVYEDLAIASYLICLWEAEEQTTKRRPTFVDLGCGNGLLTWLLSSEGYAGHGVDIAERKIWAHLRGERHDMLEVQALYPDKVTYNVDWIIGNHADELVPWIPIIASKSGANCKFLVIPCCLYGLDGTRTLALKGDDGKYRAYTNYIRDIIDQCGFTCEEDYLRIPSTKNIALVGRSRHSTPSQEAIDTLAAAGTQFAPRKTDREKEQLRQLAKADKKRPKTE